MKVSIPLPTTVLFCWSPSDVCFANVKISDQVCRVVVIYYFMYGKYGLLGGK